MSKKKQALFSIIKEWTEGKIALPQFVNKATKIATGSSGNQGANSSSTAPSTNSSKAEAGSSGGSARVSSSVSKISGGLKISSGSGGGSGGGSGSTTSSVRSVSGRSSGSVGNTRGFGFAGSKVIIKTNYINGIKRVGAHLKYIENRQQNERSELFGKNADNMDRTWFTDKLRRYDNVHRIVVSPAEKDIDLKELVRETMKSFEKDKNRDLIWIAAIHKDPKHTSHPHVHLVVSGTDTTGRKLRVERPDIEFLKKETSRYVAREKNLFYAIENVFKNEKEKDLGL